MAELQCGLCSLRFPVSDVDPDASLDEVVQHMARMHAGDPLAGDPGVIKLVGQGASSSDASRETRS